jgi:hypothetical protein
MAGVKGAGGPPPKRSDQRRRRNTPAAGDAETVADSFDVVVPPEGDAWHEVAKVWYRGLASSGQSVFYTSSDWATAYLLAESISRELKPQPIVVGSGESREVEMHELPPKGASLAAWLKGMTALLVTEGDRRRAALELQRPKPAEAEEAGSVSSLDAWRSRVDGTG